MPVKKYTAFLIIVFMSLKAGAQYSIPDSGFENWTNSISNSQSFQYPTGWLTPDSITLTNGGIAEVTLSTDAYSGSYAAQLETQSLYGNAIPGFLLLGQFNLVQKNITGGVPFMISDYTRPDSLTGYYKYTPPSGKSDSCLIYIVLMHYNDTLKKRDTVGIGSFGDSVTTKGYTRFAFGINYNLTYHSEQIDTIQLGIFSSGNFLTAQFGSTMLVDDLSFDTTVVTGIRSVVYKSYSISCYPNPANSYLNILISEPHTGMIIKVYDVPGRNLLSANNRGLITPVDVSNLSNGTYFFEVIDRYGNLLKTEKFSILR